MSARSLGPVIAEFVGTAFLVMAVVGSGIAAQRLSPGQPGLQLLENSVVTGAALTALILTLRPVSASFNPVVTLTERLRHDLDTKTAAALITAQVTGGLVGCMVANLMFSTLAVSLSAHHRAVPGALLGEVVATAGLVLVVFGSARRDQVAIAVGGYITAAYWFTSSTSFANPAVTIARLQTDSFAGIAASSVVPFIVCQLVGGLAGFGLVSVLFPRADRVPQLEGATR